MTTFKRNLDKEVIDEYDFQIFAFFEQHNPEEKRELIDEVVTKIVEKRDFKTLCGFLHIFIDNFLCEDFIKQDCYDFRYNHFYIYFMKSIDTYIELPECYYKNRTYSSNKGDPYYNFYVNLRTLIDHYLISYRKEKLHGKVKSCITDLAKKVYSKKPFNFKLTNQRINNKFNVIEEKNLSQTIRFTYKNLYNNYMMAKTKKGEFDKDLARFLDEFDKILQFYDKTEFAKLAHDIIVSEDIEKIIYILFEFSSFTNKIGTYGYSFLTKLIFEYLAEYISNFYVEDEDILNDKDFEIPWNQRDINYKDCFYIIKVIVPEIMLYIENSSIYDFENVLVYERQIYTFVTKLIRVNKFYTDILGKSMDEFYIGYLANLFDADPIIFSFGIDYGSVEYNTLILFLTEVIYFNNITSTDYTENIKKHLNEAMNAFIHPIVNPDFYLSDIGAIGEMAKFTIHMLKEIFDFYSEIYGEVINPMNQINLKQYRIK